MSLAGKKAILGLTRALKRVRKGKGMPLDFIWRKNADAVVNECRRKAGEKSKIMITVLTWFTDRFLWSPGSVTEVIPSFGSFPQMFSYCRSHTCILQGSYTVAHGGV